MLLLVLGLILFIGVHTLTMMREQRAALIAGVGEGPFKGLYALASFAGLILIVWGYVSYRAGGYIPVWEPPRWTRHLAWTLMLPVFPLLVAAYIPGRIKQAAKHPMLLAVKIWATAHLIANGDLGSILLFGSVLAWAVACRISVKRRAEQSAITMAQPADATAATRNDLIALVVGLAIYALILVWLHPILFGVSALG
ncbi:NnrU family protein [Terrarubrum flagellatum]|uniref:NnrU family protein n=1 Tax=Terrirubrum flagellatum TaxID=2895980 RepID=UPI003145042B